MLTLDQVAELALGLPGAHERPAWGLRCFRVRDKIFAVVRPDLGGFAVKAAEDEIVAMAAEQPEVFSVPTHYRGYGMVLVQTERVDPAEAREVLVESWRRTAPPALIRAFDAASDADGGAES